MEKKIKETPVVICRECNREVLTSYQEIQTKRKTTVIICDECLEKMRRAANSARDSK